jgi:hypothetical protein
LNRAGTGFSPACFKLDTRAVLAYSAGTGSLCRNSSTTTSGASNCPPGCKDLADLFKPAWLRKLPKAVAPTEVPVVLCSHSFKKTVGDIEKYAATIFDSRAVVGDLTSSTPDEKLVVSISRTMEDIMSHIQFVHDEARETAMRVFFDRHGLATPDAEEMPKEFNIPFPDLPVWSIFALSPVPSGTPAFSKIASALFREFCEMNDQSELQFFLVEFEKPK